MAPTIGESNAIFTVLRWMGLDRRDGFTPTDEQAADALVLLAQKAGKVLLVTADEHEVRAAFAKFVAARPDQILPNPHSRRASRRARVPHLRRRRRWRVQLLGRRRLLGRSLPWPHPVALLLVRWLAVLRLLPEVQAVHRAMWMPDRDETSRRQRGHPVSAELPDAVYQAVCDSFWQAENQPLRAAFAAAYAAGIQAGRVNVTEYTFNEHPDENTIDHELYRVTVAYRGHGQWGVYQRSSCVDADGRLCREPIPGDRDPQWLAGHRFDLETALRLAQELAPKVTVNGLTAAGQAQWEANLKARTP